MSNNQVSHTDTCDYWGTLVKLVTLDGVVRKEATQHIQVRSKARYVFLQLCKFHACLLQVSMMISIKDSSMNAKTGGNCKRNNYMNMSTNHRMQTSHIQSHHHPPKTTTTHDSVNRAPVPQQSHRDYDPNGYGIWPHHRWSRKLSLVETIRTARDVEGCPGMRAMLRLSSLRVQSLKVLELLRLHLFNKSIGKHKNKFQGRFWWLAAAHALEYENTWNWGIPKSIHLFLRQFFARTREATM